MTISMNYNRGKLRILYCSSGEHFALKVVSELEKFIECLDYNVLISSKEVVFANSEIKTEIEECIRNQDVYIFQDVQNNSGGLSVNDNVMALKTAINAAKLANAHCITAVLPVYPYARQDKAKAREGISASMLARELEGCGVGRVITLDIHNEAIAGFFRYASLENLRVSKTLIDFVKNNFDVDNLVVAAPDAGGAERANFFAKKLNTKLVLMHKERDYSRVSSIENMSLIGDVSGRDVFVVDDIIDTAGTLVNSAKKFKENGARKVIFAASLPLFSGRALERIDLAFKEGFVDLVIGTNVIFKPSDFSKLHPWYVELELQKYFAKVIYNINKGDSIGKLLD
ncbi:MAG: ribose-phosphate diphosphokinase [Candidatus Woesearchaeota archaeon]